MNKKTLDNKFKLHKIQDTEVEDLYISSKFPPLNDISGIVLSKRIIEANKKVDVVQINYPEDENSDWTINEIISNYINNRIYVTDEYTPNSIESIMEFKNKGIIGIFNTGIRYKTVTSRSWTLESHFLALEYKFENPSVEWTAEFSDPMRVDINNQLYSDGQVIITDENYINKINKQIIALNNKNNTKYPLITKHDTRHFLAEYLPFLFADKIRFTNDNQRQVMLDIFPIDIKEYVYEKSEVKRHPTFPEEFYHIKQSDYTLDESKLNIAYFGTYLGKRNLEYLFYAFEQLPDEIISKIKLHLFISNKELLKKLVQNLKIAKSIEISDKIPYLEFLNLSTRMDILLVNDTKTSNCFKINPYLPSKISDYLGSSTDIWAVCEKNSSMDKMDIKYKSYIDDFTTTEDILYRIIEDKLQIKINDNKNESDYNRYLENRITSLNHMLDLTEKNRLFFINHSDKMLKLANDTKAEYNQKVIENNNLKKKLNTKKDDEYYKKLQEDYDGINKLIKRNFKKLDEKNKTIKVQKQELSYYKNHQSLYSRLIGEFIALIYLKYKLNDNVDISIKLYKLLRQSPLFNCYEYLCRYDDLSRFKWTKLFNPELHYVCHGHDEHRVFNEEVDVNLSKNEIIKKITY